MAPPTASNESLQQHSWGKSRKDHHGGSPGSLYERDSSSGQASSSTRSKSRKRTRRCALDKARQAALSYTLEVSDGMKAFDGPPLGPQDVKDLLRRNFRIAMSTSEAVALIKDFRHDEAKVSGSHFRVIGSQGNINTEFRKNAKPFFNGKRGGQQSASRWASDVKRTAFQYKGRRMRYHAI